MNAKKLNQNEVILDVDETEFTLQYWRTQFDVLYEKEPHFERRNLIIYDGYFMLAVGKDAIRRVKLGKGGFEPTRKVVLALLKYIEDKELNESEIKGLSKRQKLVIPC